jgi:acetylornithine deacetylase
MPVGNLSEWKIGRGGNEINLNPLQLTSHDGKLYGRGSVDMKGPIAATICAIEPLVQLASKFKRELIFGLTYDEEVGLRGARRMVEEKIVSPKFTLVAEPTQLIPMRMHKGHLCLTAFCHGKRAHAADPDKGRNAIELAAKVILELEQFSEELKCVIQPLIDPPHATLNIALAAGGSKLNEVPDGCLISFAIRPIPGQSVQRIREYIADRLMSIGGCDRSGNPIVVVDLFEKTRQSTDPMITPSDSELVLVAESVSNEAARGVCYSTDASVLQHLGTDCVIFGPGCIDAAHKPNEYIEIEQLHKGVDQFREIARRMLLEGGLQ